MDLLRPGFRAPSSPPRSTDTLGLADGSPAPNRPWWVTLYRLGAGFAPPPSHPLSPVPWGTPCSYVASLRLNKGRPSGLPPPLVSFLPLLPRVARPWSGARLLGVGSRVSPPFPVSLRFTGVARPVLLQKGYPCHMLLYRSTQTLPTGVFFFCCLFFHIFAEGFEHDAISRFSFLCHLV